MISISSSATTRESKKKKQDPKEPRVDGVEDDHKPSPSPSLLSIFGRDGRSSSSVGSTTSGENNTAIGNGSLSLSCQDKFIYDSSDSSSSMSSTRSNSYSGSNSNSNSNSVSVNQFRNRDVIMALIAANAAGSSGAWNLNHDTDDIYQEPIEDNEVCDSQHDNDNNDNNVSKGLIESIVSDVVQTINQNISTTQDVATETESIPLLYDKSENSSSSSSSSSSSNSSKSISTLSVPLTHDSTLSSLSASTSLSSSSKLVPKEIEKTMIDINNSSLPSAMEKIEESFHQLSSNNASNNKRLHSTMESSSLAFGKSSNADHHEHHHQKEQHFEDEPSLASINQCIQSPSSISISQQEDYQQQSISFIRHKNIQSHSLYSKFVQYFAHCIDYHDLHHMMEVLFQPFLEPDMRLLTKYWNKTTSSIATTFPSSVIQNEQQRVSSSSSFSSTSSYSSASQQYRFSQHHPQPHHHPYGAKDLVKNGSFHALKLFAFHFNLIPDGVFRLYDTRIVPTIGVMNDGRVNEQESGVRVISSFRYSGTLVSPLPLPECDEVHDVKQIKSFLDKMKSSASLINVPIMKTDGNALEAVDWESRIVEARYASYENRHHKNELTKNIIGDNPEEVADVLKRIGGVFSADHWLRKPKMMETTTNEGTILSQAFQEPLKFVSQNEMLAALSMMGPSLPSPSPEVYKVEGGDSGLSSSISSSLTQRSSEGISKSKKRMMKSVYPSAVNPNPPSTHMSVDQDAEGGNNNKFPVGLLEEFSALFRGGKNANHAVKLNVNVSGYFIVHFNKQDKVDRIEFHYYDV